MRKVRRTTSVAAALALAAAIGSPAGANPHSGVDAELYKPSLDPFGLWSLDAATGLAKHDFSFKVGVGYAQTPLTLPVPGIGQTTDDETPDAALEFSLRLNLTAALALTNRLSIAFDTGLYRTNPDAGYGTRGRYTGSGETGESTGLISLRPVSNIDPSGGYEPQGEAGPVDARVAVKYRLLTGKLRAAVIGIVSLPFGEDEMFLGDAGIVLEPKVALEYGLGPNSRIVANIGAKLRERTVLEAYAPANGESAADARAVFDLGSELLAGVGVLYEVAPQLSLAAEGTIFMPLPESLALGGCTLDSGADCDSLTDEDYFAGGEYGDPAALAIGGLNYRATPDTTLSVAGGVGGLLGDGRGEDFRVMGGVSWSPTPEGTRVIGRGDMDGDGISDRIDICPEEPEDNDDYQDDDGCPDLDNDGDGVIDAQDACPGEPEDKDGFKDDDGCPERDNDGDNVADVTDRCPNDPEDMDKFEDDDGCPDEDNDGDGIADAKDKCPNEAETVNGIDDLDGCPDEDVAGGPQMDLTRINLQGASLKFRGNSATLTKADKEILDAVADLLNDRRWSNVRVRLEVHVALGTKSKNKRRIRTQRTRDSRLSQQRADAVMAYLVTKGVDAGRVQAAGLGSTRPITQPETDAANNRVDFIRTEQR